MRVARSARTMRSAWAAGIIIGINLLGDNRCRRVLVNINRGLISWPLVLLVDNRRKDSCNEEHDDVGDC